MLALTIFGSIVLAGALFAIARRFRESKIECGPLDPCLGGSAKRTEKSATS